MEARASGRNRGLLFVVVLLLLQSTTARGFSAGSPLVTDTYLSTGTQDSVQTADLSTLSRAVISEGTVRFGSSSTSEISEPSEKLSHTGTDQRLFTEITESWTTRNRLDTSTEILESSPAFSINTVSEWEDPSPVTNITNDYTGAEEWQPAPELRTVRDLTLTKLTEQEHTEQDTTESSSNTYTQEHADQDASESAPNTNTQEHADQDTTESAPNTNTQEHADQDASESASNTYKQQHPDQDTTESAPNTYMQEQAKRDITESAPNTYTQEHADQDASESASNTYKQQSPDQDTTESSSNTFTQEHADQNASESASNTYKQQSPDQDTTESSANTFTQEQADQDASESAFNTYKQQSPDQDTTESAPSTYMQEQANQDASEFASNTYKQQHTDHDATESASNTFMLEHTDQDTTEFGLNTDSTYISTTFNRAGERTLLSITSNSTSPYVEDSSFSSSETAPHAVTGVLEKTEGTQHMAYTRDTKSGHSETMPWDVPANATQEKVFDISVFHNSQDTESHTEQPTATGSDLESMSRTSTPSSTPPLTVINSSDSDMDTTGSSFTNQSFYTDSSSPSSFTPPDDTHTNVSHQDGETTDVSTGPVSTSAGKKIDEPNTFMEETTIPGVTTAPSTLWEMTTSMYDTQSTQQNFVFQTDSPTDPTDLLSTATGPSTNNPPLTEKNTNKAITPHVSSTTLESTRTTAALTTHQYQASTINKLHTMPHTTLSVTETSWKTTATTERHHPTTGTATSSLSASSSQFKAGATDVSTLHFETSTATPSSTTAHSQHTTASYNKVASTISTAVITTGKRTKTEATSTQMPVKLSLAPDHMCPSHICANGGKCLLTSGGYRCECLPAWRGENCTEDVDECVSSPCPQDSVCVNTRGSFSCDCALGYDLQDGRSCTQTRTFLGIFSINSSLHESHREILQLLNASLSNLHGYRRSTLRYLGGLHILAVNMFSMSANVTSIDIFGRIQTSLRNCNKQQSHCSLKHQHKLTYQMESLCSAQKNRCDTQYAECSDSDGTPYCQCHEGYFKRNPEDSTCRDCGDGFKLVNGTCMECPFGFGGFNCNNFYGLIAKIVSPAAGGLLLIVIIALIVTCCRKDKNDINKIIFKSGDLQMSPYGDFPKSSRVSMEWGRETIEMQENGSTKNLLQMTDIYYSPALRNADLDRNGLYPFSGLPGSRHSCIYPAQWNPSFISDDSRRRDYF